MKSTEKHVNPSFLTGLKASIELMRPANIVTAFSDILAGFAVAGGAILILDGEITVTYDGLTWLLFSTFGLYGGGVVMNDYFDAELDAKERPERAIPSGRISKTRAMILGFLLLIVGVAAAFQVNHYAGFLALFIAISALLYDYKAKHSKLFGPLFMGLCRGGNLLLGMSLVPLVLLDLWPLMLIPLAYIGSITLISQGEVKGGSQAAGYLALSLVLLITVVLLLLSILPEYELFPAVPFAILFGALVIPPFAKAARAPGPDNIKDAVKRGVISLIILNSTLAAGFGGLFMGLIVVLLLPLSFLLAKAFAVT